MGRRATLAYPLARVFDHLAAPACLGDWLPEITGIEVDARPTGRADVSFAVRISDHGTECAGTGELIAYEPPWYVAYRLVTDLHTHVLRLTCASSDSGTRVHIHQSGDAAPLPVDLAQLQQALAGDGGDNDSP